MNRVKALITGALIAWPCLAQSALAVTFGQAEVSQEKLIAIAVPHQSGYYSLLVLEQLSSKKDCWSESGSNPVRVEPLLLKFDFTGICGRSTDSNGYSLRIADQDVGMTYHLSLQKRGNDLVLLGMPKSSKDKPIEVGHTAGIQPGFLKISLSPGWHFAKRTYSGKTLGHIYFSRATPAPTVEGKQILARNVTAERPKVESAKAAIFKVKRSNVSAKPARSLPSSKPQSVAAKPKPATREKLEISQGASSEKPQTQLALSKKPKPLVTSKPDATKSSSPSRQTALPQRNLHYKVVVITSDAAQQNKVRSKMPQAFRTVASGKTAMQIGLFSDRSKAESLKSDLKRQGFEVLIIQKPDSKVEKISQSSSEIKTIKNIPDERPVLTVPSANVPIGQVRGAKNVYTSQSYLPQSKVLPPSPPPQQLESQFRVVVPIRNPREQTQIRSLVPGAFQSRYKGQSVMQVGIFTRAEEAKPMINLMEQHGFSPIQDQT